ncbi:MAG TPA: acetyl-CoA carboxylase biotin carboxyl carrier protein [Solirubrobacteraceae bacterium]|jgi:acetyl-CoA carboxylase biotin carboxyl carrier protein|nr:acetyl-CoA carboxylase biotin carboxyl carrier protein [Solirubrobacteraceae bacterium]
MTVDIAYLRKLIEAFEQSDWDEIHLRGEDFEIRLSTSADEPAAASAPAGAAAPAATPVATPAPAGNGSAPAAQAAPVNAPAATGAAGEPVVSPSVGIFWRAPSPTSPPFVDVGDEVTEESTLCIVEVMKLMTQVGAGMSGRVVDILVANGESVEKGQPLFTIQPT